MFTLVYEECLSCAPRLQYVLYVVTLSDILNAD